MSARHPAGFPTHVVRLSDGPRRVLAIHCSLGHCGMWRPLAAALEGTGAAFEAFDLPGHGRSADWPGQPDYHDLATAIADSLAGATPVDLIGHSFGATVALRLALERAAAVRSLVLIEPVLFAAADPAVREARRRVEAGMAEALAAGEAEAAARAFLADWGDGTPWDLLPAPQRRNLAARMPLVAATAPALWEDAAGLLVPGRLEALRRPVLLLRGDRSPAVIASICAGLPAWIPAAWVETVPGAGHMLPLTHPAETAERLRRAWSV